VSPTADSDDESLEDRHESRFATVATATKTNPSFGGSEVKIGVFTFGTGAGRILR